MNSLTAHEFYAKHPNAKSFPSMKEARAWQDLHGGHIWHVARSGSIRPGPPLLSAEAILVTGYS